MLDKIDWDILMEYDRDVFQSYHSISQTIGVHHSTVHDRIDNMKANYILQPDTIFKDTTRNLDRPMSEVIGRYSPSTLGLERIHVLFKRIGSKPDFDKLWYFCEEHPYTHYLVQLFGTGASIYAQFDIPKETYQLHKLTFQSLANDYVEVGDIEVYRDRFEARAIPNYDRARKFDWSNSDNIISHLWEEFEVNRADQILRLPKLGKPIDNIDAEIIRELTINGKTKITDLADHFNLNKSTLSRRVSRIRENYVTSGVLAFGRNAFKEVGFNNTQLITGKFSKGSPIDPETVLKFISSNNILPMDAFVTVDSDKFLLYTRGSVAITDDMLRFMFNNSDPVELNQYQFYMNHSIRYPFYHLNYNEEFGFNKEEEYIKENAIAVINN